MLMQYIGNKFIAQDGCFYLNKYFSGFYLSNIVKVYFQMV